MFKPTRPLLKARRRLALTTKQAANKGGYYKGNRTGSQGWHTIWGGYIIDLRKVRTYVPPGNFATDTKAWEHLTPFVAKYIKKPEKLGARDESKSDEKAEKTDSEFERIEEWNGTGALTGKRYLRLWKEWYLEQTEDDVDNTALTRDGSTGNKVVQN